MRLTVTLEDERRKVVEMLGSALVIDDAIDLSGFKLLRYLDPYGDTMFNQMQMDDLLLDLNRLAGAASQPAAAQIIELAKQCKGAVHIYLWFYGD